MQPAFHIIGLKPDATFEDVTYEVTRAEDTTWHFVHKADAAVAVAQAADPIRLRCESGQPCPREGFWITPAKTNSRRHFKVGEPMPDLQSDYGATIWQWDEQQ